MHIDHKKLDTLKVVPVSIPGPDKLRRAGSIFFVGANLPVSDTLETMFESFCMESTELFHLAFGAADNFDKALEMARQIKKNFNVRLMGTIDFLPNAQRLEQAYASGVDLLAVPFQLFGAAQSGDRQRAIAAFVADGTILPRWSLISTILLTRDSIDAIEKNIDDLLESGIIPLPLLNQDAGKLTSEEIARIFQYLRSGWQQHRVPIKPLLPYIRLVTPLIPEKSEGVLRAFISRVHDRQLRAVADLRRHLRVHAAEDSLDSAGL